MCYINKLKTREKNNMDWVSFLIYLNIRTATFCDSLLIPQDSCMELVQECVLDGEGFEWCEDDYIRSL